MKIGRPAVTEAAPYFFRYIDQVQGDDPILLLQGQYETVTAALKRITESQSLYRYDTDKWSAREVVNHINDAERLFSFRAFWFARGFSDALPSFDQVAAAAEVKPDLRPFSSHIAEFQHLRCSTLALFENLPETAWTRSGVASGHVFTVRALAFVIAGHCTHHLSILQKHYLKEETR